MVRAVVQLHLASAAQHLGRDHLAAPLGRIDHAALPGRDLLQLGIGLMLILQAAHQTAAHAGNLRRVERQVLVLRHVDGHRVEIVQIRAAAQLAPAGAQPADHLGLVAHADLAQFNARAEHAGKVLDQLAEVHAPVRGKVKQHFTHVKRAFRGHKVHFQTALLDLALAHDKRLVRTPLVALDRFAVRIGRDAHHAPERLHHRLLGNLGVSLHTAAVLQPARGIHDNIRPRSYLDALRVEIIHFSV